VNANDLPAEERSAATLFDDLCAARPERPAALGRIIGVVIGELLALHGDDRAPLVRFSGQPGTAALVARRSIDLSGQHIGHEIVLMFENGDPLRPIVIGLLRGQSDTSGLGESAQVDVDADGERMIVSVKEELVLRCGKASITLTKSGKVLIEGTSVLSRATGTNRIKGGSIQLN
jgi:hypothetical protein